MASIGALMLSSLGVGTKNHVSLVKKQLQQAFLFPIKLNPYPSFITV